MGNGLSRIRERMQYQGKMRLIIGPRTAANSIRSQPRRDACGVWGRMIITTDSPIKGIQAADIATQVTIVRMGAETDGISLTSRLRLCHIPRAVMLHTHQGVNSKVVCSLQRPVIGVAHRDSDKVHQQQMKFSYLAD